MTGPLESETCRDVVMPALLAAGWRPEQIVEQYAITAGRVIPVGSRHRRGQVLFADYVLEYAPGVPVAVVEAKRAFAIPGQGMQQAKRYAAMLDVSLAYATNGAGVVEDDRHTGREQEVIGYPTPQQAWARHRTSKGITTDLTARGTTVAFTRAVTAGDGTVKVPRYYQQVAINRAVAQILEGDDRILLTMATGTGKTFVAMQIVWKLWESGWRSDRRPRVLFLADRSILVTDPMDREFKPVFGGGDDTPIWRLQGAAKPGRELYFALYQAIADRGADPTGIFRHYDPDFFDLVIIDECHRGSAVAETAWRSVLDHFSSATQLGLTATPKRDETADTYRYFGEPLYEYSLAQGIDDGFLAPYRVRRVTLSPDAHGWAPDPGELDRFGKEIPPGLYRTPDFERVVSLLARTETAAAHLTAYLKATDRFAKTIVFCVDQEHADQMRRALHNANADLTKAHPDYVVRIVSDEGSIGKAHLDRFKDVEADTPVIATTSQLLSTGIDMPTVKNIVLFRPIGSMALFKQIIGRGTRLRPDEDKWSFEIIDYTGATRLFQDPAFDGPPEQVVEEEIDDDGEVVDPPEVRSDDPPFDDEDDAAVDPATLRRKLYVDGAEVYVANEGMYRLDPATDRLVLVEYRDYVAEQVRTLFPDPTALRSAWTDRIRRADIERALDDHGIDLAELAERTGLTASDPLDILVHVAWHLPVMTRSARARRVRLDHQDFFDDQQPQARAVLEQLLEKYTQHGIGQLDDLRILQTAPLTELGSPTEIAARFGGADAMRDAITGLGLLIYAA